MSESATATMTKPAAKKAAPKAKAPKAGNGKLRKTQERMLKLLAKKDRCNRQQLVKAATGRDNGTLDGSHLGCLDPKARAIADKKSGKPSLLTLGYVRHIPLPIPESTSGGVEHWFEITASGRKAIAK